MNSSNINPEKQAALDAVLSQAQNKKPTELINFLVSYASSKDHVNFSDSETDKIVNELKKNMSPNDIKKIDTIKQISKILEARANNSKKQV